MKTFSFLILLLAIVVLSGCTKGEKALEVGTTKSPYFVQTYIDANNLKLEEIEGVGIYTIGMFFFGKEISNLTKSDPVRFKQLAKSFNDGTYNKYVLPGSNMALTEPLTSVSIVCDKEYDAEHQSGSNLDDIVLFCATSPYEFIQSGYKEMVRSEKYPAYWKYMVMNQSIGYEPVEMLVGAVNKENSYMLYPNCYLYFKKRPEQDGEYIFTVTVRMGERDIVRKIAHVF